MTQFHGNCKKKRTMHIQTKRPKGAVMCTKTRQTPQNKTGSTNSIHILSEEKRKPFQFYICGAVECSGGRRRRREGGRERNTYTFWPWRRPALGLGEALMHLRARVREGEKRISEWGMEESNRFQWWRRRGARTLTSSWPSMAAAADPWRREEARARTWLPGRGESGGAGSRRRPDRY